MAQNRRTSLSSVGHVGEDPWADPPVSSPSSPPQISPPPNERVPAPPRSGGSISARARAGAIARVVGPAYLEKLNAEQRLAVETLDGPLLVLAGAGTGKTRVLTTRIAHILATGRARPGQVLAVTFTNKAAREMKERIGHLIGGEVEGMPWLGTFHSIGVRILRRHAEIAGLKSGFTILDTDDQLRLLKQVIEASGIDKDRWPARALASLIDGWKNRGQTPDLVPKGEAFAFANGKGAQLYADYQARLKELNACDFGDLLLECVRLFREHPDVLADYRARFRYMLVDEYQDTNVVQYQWLKLLALGTDSPSAAGQSSPRPVPEQRVSAANEHPDRPAPPATTWHTEDDEHLGLTGDLPPAPHATVATRELEARRAPNICCVGDDDQSIYGWRGAEVENILRFEKDFPGATVIRLERNYRSTGNILAAASQVIAQNKGRLGKTLFTDGDAGDKVTVTSVWDDTEEARVVGEHIESSRKAGHKLNQMAILVRASYQMRAFEDRFITLGLPYRVIGGPRFYERAEIKDAIAYLEVVHNPTHDLKFERIINVPKRGIGDTTVARIIALSRARAMPLALAAAEMIQGDELTPKTRRSIGDLLAALDRWRQRGRDIKHTELAEMILDESGYTAMLQADKSPQAHSRLENLKELVRFMHDFDTLEGFLEHVSLVMDTDKTNDGDRVSLMTLHAAKGLEFDTVFLPGWEEGLFPSQRSMDENGVKGLEEERRLAYVGITRARKRAHISFTENRRTRGLFQSATPSRFVDELPEDHVEVIEAKGPFSGAYRNLAGGGGYGQSRFDQPSFQSSYQTPGWQRAQASRAEEQQGRGSWNDSSGSRYGGNAGAGAPRQKWPDKKHARAPTVIEGRVIASSQTVSEFKVGDRVFHDKFGYGHVKVVEGNKLTVDFDKAGQKHVVDSFLERG
jgi:DNA helicase-2/ATP-dependent DNA helicase PcrA